MLSKMERTKKFRVKLFKALADPDRLEILEFLRDGEKCVCEITPHLNLIQPVVSRHLRILKECGLVKYRKDSNRRLYAITDNKIFKIIDEITPEFANTFLEKMLDQMM